MEVTAARTRCWCRPVRDGVRAGLLALFVEWWHFQNSPVGTVNTDKSIIFSRHMCSKKRGFSRGWMRHSFQLLHNRPLSPDTMNRRNRTTTPAGGDAPRTVAKRPATCEGEREQKATPPPGDGPTKVDPRALPKDLADQVINGVRQDNDEHAEDIADNLEAARASDGSVCVTRKSLTTQLWSKSQCASCFKDCGGRRELRAHLKNHPDHGASKRGREVCVKHMADVNRELLEDYRQRGKVDMFILPMLVKLVVKVALLRPLYTHS